MANRSNTDAINETLTLTGQAIICVANLAQCLNARANEYPSLYSTLIAR